MNVRPVPPHALIVGNGLSSQIQSIVQPVEALGTKSGHPQWIRLQPIFLCGAGIVAVMDASMERETYETIIELRNDKLLLWLPLWWGSVLDLLYEATMNRKQEIIKPKDALLVVETVREQIDNLAQTSNQTMKAVIEKFPKSYATLRRILHGGEAYVRKVVEIHEALKVITGKEPEKPKETT